MQTCPFTTLKLHSQGVLYAPVQVGGRFRLISSAAHVLTGYRGNAYQFASANNAMTWLCTNLSRAKKHAGNTSPLHIAKLHKIYSQTQFAPVLVELEVINEMDAGDWVAKECDECDCANEPYDGGDAFTIFNN